MSGDPNDSVTAAGKHPTKQPWQPPRLTYEGSTGELIQVGSGKSGVSADPGEPLKPPGGAG